MLHVVCPVDFAAEREWIFGVILGDFLGLAFQLRPEAVKEVRIETSGRSLVVPDVFFARMTDARGERSTMPTLPLGTWDVHALGGRPTVTDHRLPVVYGDTDFSITEHRIRLPLDIFGSAFMLLSRYEETLDAQHDVHGRFTAAASIAQRAGFLHRPIVDEYVEVLWDALHRLWPQLQRRECSFELFVSCDVDTPFDHSVRTPAAALRRMTGDLVKRHSPALAINTLSYAWAVHRKGIKADRMWRFGWMMDVCERANTPCAFYFLTDSRHPLDGINYWNDPAIDRLLSNIHTRGHEIGLHASYTTPDDPVGTASEFERLRTTCRRLGIEQERWGGRQHYLRWQATQTWRNWSQAGLGYDSTLAFAEAPGFRCGTCHPYRVFDTSERQPLALIERPLVVMDVSVFSPRYLGQDPEQGLETIHELKAVVRRFAGEFGLLWHNSSLLTDDQQRVFSQVLLANA